jgi:phosphatidylglycerophosphate synthase
MATPASNQQAAGQSAADVHTLDTAILLPIAPVFAEEQPPQSASSAPTIDCIGPLTPVGGVPLCLRTVLTLQRAGITNVIILSGAEEDSLKRLLTHDPRMVAVLRWMPLREFPLDDPRTWEALGQDVRGAGLVVGAHAVFSRALIEQLRQQVQDEGGRRVLVPIWPGDKASRAEVPQMMVVPASFLNGAAWRLGTARRGTPLHQIRAHAAAEGQLTIFPLNPESAQWCQAVGSSGGIEEVERRLLHTPKGAYDSVIDAYFNRKVAKRFTRLFMKAGWSPNAITMLSLSVGFLAAGCFARGTYAAGVVGALLFQLSAIIDCCDGDVARLTFQESQFGERLDLIGDNVVHMAIFGALGWAGYLNGGGALALTLGLLAMIGNGLSLWMVTRVKERDRQRGWTNPVQAAQSTFILKNMASRDFSIIVLLFALLNLLGVFLWLAAIGSNVFWVMTAWITRSPSIRA